MENRVQLHPKKQRSHQIDRLKLTVFSTLLFNVGIVVWGTPIWANEVETQQPSTEMNTGIVNPASMDATTQTGERAVEPEQASAIYVQPIVEPQIPVAPSAVAPSAVASSTVAPLSREVDPQHHSSIGSDLSSEMDAGIVNPASMDAMTQTGEHAAKPEQASAIYVQPIVEPQMPVAPSTVAPLTVAPLSKEVDPQHHSTIDPDLSSGLQTISEKASDLLGTPEPQMLSQAGTQTPAEQPTETTPQPVNNPLLPPPGWRFDIEPYLFLPLDVKGDIFFGRGRRLLFPNRPGEISSGSGINLSVNARLSDIKADLTNIFGISGRVQAWSGNFGIVADGLHVDSGFRTTSSGGSITLRDRFNIPVPGFQIDTQNTLSTFSLAASYRLGTVPLRTITDPSNPSNYYPAVSFEVLAGARYLSVSQSVDFARGPRFDLNGDEVNPMLGGTVKLMLSQNFAFYFRGDTSNLGGGNLKQYYNLYGGIDWKFSGSFALRLAYRFNQIEFVRQGILDGDNGLNLRAQGVQLGISWQF